MADIFYKIYISAGPGKENHKQMSLNIIYCSLSHCSAHLQKAVQFNATFTHLHRTLSNFITSAHDYEACCSDVLNGFHVHLCSASNLNYRMVVKGIRRYQKDRQKSLSRKTDMANKMKRKTNIEHTTLH